MCAVKAPLIGRVGVDGAEGFPKLGDLEDHSNVYLPDLIKFGVSWWKSCFWKFVVVIFPMVYVEGMGS